MNRGRVFYQDFLFENLPVDEQDNPMVNVVYSSEKDNSTTEVSLDVLMRMNKQAEWNDFIAKIKGRKVVIIDDVLLMNTEVEPYKKMYLATYFYFISQNCSECVVRI